MDNTQNKAVSSMTSEGNPIVFLNESIRVRCALIKALTIVVKDTSKAHSASHDSQQKFDLLMIIQSKTNEITRLKEANTADRAFISDISRRKS